jgi:hypothetical protein
MNKKASDQLEDNPYAGASRNEIVRLKALANTFRHQAREAELEADAAELRGYRKGGDLLEIANVGVNKGLRSGYRNAAGAIDRIVASLEKELA